MKKACKTFTLPRKINMKKICSGPNLEAGIPRSKDLAEWLAAAQKGRKRQAR